MGIGNIKEVYILHHVHEFEDGDEDVKILGIFSSESKGIELIEKYKKQPGFKDDPEGFSADKYILDKADWVEGFSTLD